MKLQVNKKTTARKTGGKITTLLARFGVDIPKGQKQNFLHNNSGELEYIFNDAKKGYLEAIKKAHPDTGGSEKAARAVNRDWQRIKTWFSYYYPRALE